MADPSADDITYVRDLTADLSDPPLLGDELIGRLLSREPDPRLAAARALEIVATSTTLVSKKIRTQDLQTDGPAVAAELRSQAAALRAEVAGEDDGWDGFDVVPTVTGSRRPEHTNQVEAWGL